MAKYFDNRTNYCSQCHKLRYMGYTVESDSELCTCNGQDKIPTYNKMTTEQKIEAIKEAIEKAKNHQSKMDDVAWSVPALSSLKIRHLMNNLGAISTRYFECGVHKGGLFCSTIRNNDNLLYATANDSFASDEANEDKAHPQFIDNFLKCKPSATVIDVIVADTFEINEESMKVISPVDLYLFDADHSYESQRKAMIHFLPAMADEFIVCVDDFDWIEVYRGTEDGIVTSMVDVLFQETFKGNDHDNDGWWNGFAVFLLRKKKEKKAKKK